MTHSSPGIRWGFFHLLEAQNPYQMRRHHLNQMLTDA